MYLISVGPYHLDFELGMGKPEKKSRISFDLKISQVVEIAINPEIIEMEGMKEK